MSRLDSYGFFIADESLNVFKKRFPPITKKS